MTSTPTKSRREQMIFEMCRAAFKSCRPFTPAEEIVFWCKLALKDMGDESRPENERINRAVRAVSSIPFINSRLPDSALNEILGRNGVMPPADSTACI